MDELQPQASAAVAMTPNQRYEPLKVLLFSASLRKNSVNKKLCELAAKVIKEHHDHVDFARFEEFDCTSYNQDLEEAAKFPNGAIEFKKRLAACDAFIVCSPEYNFSMPGNLKNLVDWVSRYRPQPFKDAHALLMSASPSMAGGNRGLWSLRIPLEHLGVHVYPDMFSLAAAHKAFNENGELLDEKLEQRFKNTICAFLDSVEAAKHYPKIKKQWVEFLGEKTDKVTERVE